MNHRSASLPRLATFLLALLALAASAPLRAELQVGQAFPALNSAALSGPVPALSGQVAVIDFWASWCAPCKASFAAYSRLHEAYAGRGLVIVAVSVDERPSEFDTFVRKWHPPFTTVRDVGQRLVAAVKVPTMPTAYVVGRDGRVRYVHVGFHGATTEQELRTQIEALLAEKP
ncbi:MAG TPA: TlpA disulfide reductase family protein [Opitutaceae bacterium]|nr:TlpA disulfide reductase family protein [Opitutaceae bacterium]HND61422.1 TlpA disulfide reductase family protein [Opitutaceae bacterium]